MELLMARIFISPSTLCLHQTSGVQNQEHIIQFSKLVSRPKYAGAVTCPAAAPLVTPEHSRPTSLKTEK